MSNRAVRCACTALAMAAFASLASAQSEVRGVVRDSASGQPVAGAVVLALDAFGTTLSRTISGARGQYRLQRPREALLVRSLRIGFRPTTERLPQIAADVITLDITLVTVPQSLDTMQVRAVVGTARGCPVRSDRAEAAALLEQARAGLLATVIARERQPAALRVLRFERYLDLDGIEVERQTVRMDSSRNATTSFNAVRSAIDFVNRGFRSGEAGQYTYYGPDADVLLDERFQHGYCFSLASPDTARRAQTGLRFTSPTRSSTRVDIDGTLWIDTAARALHDIEFHYVGVEALAEAFNAGGRIGFRTLPNGIPFIDMWVLRLVGAPDPAADPRSPQAYAVREVGGELARAEWPDGVTWLGPQSAMHLTALTRDGDPARGTRLILEGTDYSATTDSAGRATIDDVLPGLYAVVVADGLLAPAGIRIPTERHVLVRRGATPLVHVTVPTALEHVGALCNRPPPGPTEAWVLAAVVGSDGKPAGGVHWRISRADGTRWRTVADNGLTGSDGLVVLCRGLVRHTSIEVAVWRDPKDAVRLQGIIDDALTVRRVTLPDAPVIAQVPTRRAPAASAITATGTVRDSLTGALVADARVTFVGTPFEGATDSSGAFVVGGLASGDYVVEVSTPSLDSVGIVARTFVSLAAPPQSLSLFVPSPAAMMLSACGAADVTGFIAGSVARRIPQALPAGLRVVAEWRASASDSGATGAAAPPVGRTEWREATVGANGTFRMCGVPTGTAVVLRTEADSAAPWGSVPRTVTVPDARRFARIDLALDSARTGLATLVGSVVADTAGLPIENVEVTLADIGRSVLTDRRGAFRVSDVPPGPHLLTVKHVGYAPVSLPLDLAPNSVVERRVLLARVNALAAVSITAEGTPSEFEERRATGLGHFLTRADLEKHRGGRLGDILGQIPGFGAAAGGAGHMWVVGKRAPSHLLPNSGSGGAGCGNVRPTVRGQPPPCQFTADDLRNQGYYCPTQAERAQGIPLCACFSQVYLDGRLLNNSRPTDPFDANTLPVDDIVGVEFYPTAASTPGRYSSPNALCGVMLVWTRR